jgi:hypothetical protein
MKEQDKWKDQHVKSLTDISSEKSITERVRDVLPLNRKHGCFLLPLQFSTGP